jgi:DNA modification methylase
VPQLYPGKKHAAGKGADRAGKPSGNPLGKNPSDFWTFSAEEVFRTDSVWEIPNIKAGHPEQTIHPCQFPHELAERCVLAFSSIGEVVLDPFVGSGTTVLAALKADRRAIGIDKSSEYVMLTERRVSELREGRLVVRRSGMPVITPPATHAVSQIPKVWEDQK